MLDVRLPDGRWVTTPFYAGFGQPAQCADDAHQWADQGPVVALDDKPRFQPQTCAVCGWHRCVYLDNPHPEVE